MRSLRTTDDDSESVSEDMKDAFGPLSLVEGIKYVFTPRSNERVIKLT